MSALPFSVLAGLNYSVVVAISSFILGQERQMQPMICYSFVCLFVWGAKRKLSCAAQISLSGATGKNNKPKLFCSAKVCWEIACRFVSIFGTGAMTLLRELWNTHLNDLYNVYCVQRCWRPSFLKFAFVNLAYLFNVELSGHWELARCEQRK